MFTVKAKIQIGNKTKHYWTRIIEADNENAAHVRSSVRAPILSERSTHMKSYDSWKQDNDEDGDDRHDYFIEAKCHFCGQWEICIELCDEYICEQCQIKAEDER